MYSDFNERSEKMEYEIYDIRAEDEKEPVLVCTLVVEENKIFLSNEAPKTITDIVGLNELIFVTGGVETIDEEKVAVTTEEKVKPGDANYPKAFIDLLKQIEYDVVKI
jgi:hypothetical protein